MALISEKCIMNKKQYLDKPIFHAIGVDNTPPLPKLPFLEVRGHICGENITEKYSLSQCTMQLGNLDTDSRNSIQNQELSLHLIPI